MQAPLPERMRPKILDDYVGQDHLVGPHGALTPMIASGNLPSLLFWGPPGTGKTTLAHLMAQQHERPFYALSAIQAVKEVREVIEKAKNNGGLFTKKVRYSLMKFIVSAKPNRTPSGGCRKRVCCTHWRHHRKPEL